MQAGVLVCALSHGIRLYTKWDLSEMWGDVMLLDRT